MDLLQFTITHDALNRLHDAKEVIGTTEQWNQTFKYDRYGNRTFDEALTTTLPKNCTNGGQQVVCQADNPVAEFGILIWDSSAL